MTLRKSTYSNTFPAKFYRKLEMQIIQMTSSDFYVNAANVVGIMRIMQFLRFHSLLLQN